MEKAITTALLVIASIIASVALINAVIPAVGRSTSALLGANNAASDRIKTDIEILFATGDTAADQIILWTKNVGSKTIKPIAHSDVFVTTPTNVQRVPYTGSGVGTPYWEYAIENGTEWSQAVTVKLTLHMGTLSTGSHTVTLAVYNSVQATKEFSI